MQNLSNQTNKNTNPNLFKRSIISTSVVLAAVILATSTVQPVLAASPDTITTTVTDGQQVHEVMHHDSNPQEILKMAGVETSEEDLIVVTQDKERMDIIVKRAAEVVVTADGQSQTIACHTGDTVAQVLEQAGISLGGDDQVNLKLDAEVQDGTAITVTRYYHVYLVDNGIARVYSIPEGTVAQSMASTDFVLQGDDEFSNAEETVRENLVIGVDHVTYEEIEVTEEIPYSVVKESSDTLYKGSTQVKTKGVNGSKIVTKRQKLVNGEVVSAEVLHEEVVKQPVNEVVLLGSKAKPSAVATNISVTPQGSLVDASGKEIRYSKKIVGSCTAYTGGGTTSTGKPAAVGRVAVNPNVIPYGTKLYICSPDGRYVYGYAIAADTGGALMSGRVLCDLYMNSYGECVNFGRRPMAVYVLS